MYVISFALLALFVAASTQMPEGARTRVRRQDSAGEENEETATAEATPDGGGAAAGGGGEESTNGGGFSGMGGGLGGGIPGKDIFDAFVEKFADKNSPASGFVDRFKKFMNFMPGGGASGKGFR